MAKYHDISVELLRQLVSYDPETGALTWLPRTKETNNGKGGRALTYANTRVAGKPAFIGYHPDGYLTGAIFQKYVTAHRVAWALYHGRWPAKQIDHINGDRADNRIANLREVTTYENQQNRRMNKRNTSGCTGVFMYPGSCNWHAHITVNGCYKKLGVFKNYDDAVRVRKAAEREYGFHVNHGRP